MTQHEWTPSENTPRRHCRHCGIYEDYVNKFPKCKREGGDLMKIVTEHTGGCLGSCGSFYGRKPKKKAPAKGTEQIALSV